MIDAELINGLTLGLLAARYDNPRPIPEFHKEMWEACTSDAKKVAIAAPRSHAKSTAITHAYILAMMLFREKAFCLLISDTEGQASEFLGDIRAELEENEALQEKFGLRMPLLKSTETNIICQFNDGGKFRIQAKGSEQKVRGIKWRGKRPDLIVIDDAENDEIVMNPERRKKFRLWFMKALVPCGSKSCSIRMVGTILHLDSMLQRLLDDKTWKHLFYEACDSKFENPLWPEQFSSEELREIYESYKEQNDPEGFSQEYRNRPVSIEDAFFNKDYFFDFERDGDRALLPNLEYFAAADFAISEKETADYTAIVVGGMSPEGILHIVEVKTGRWDAMQIIDELLSTQKMYSINTWIFESVKIDKAIGPFLEKEMQKRGVYMHIHKETPTQSKTMRAASIRAMHKSGAIRYDHNASWYSEFYDELMMVGESGPRGRHDDMFDAFAYIGLAIDRFWDALSDEDLEEIEYEEEWEMFHDLGACRTTGY